MFLHGSILAMLEHEDWDLFTVPTPHASVDGNHQSQQTSYYVPTAAHTSPTTITATMSSPSPSPPASTATQDTVTTTTTTTTNASGSPTSTLTDLVPVTQLPCTQDDHTYRRARRKLLNRESARRSRKRKQMHLDGLQARADRLRIDNQGVASRLGALATCCVVLKRENLNMRLEAAALRRRLADARTVLVFRQLQRLAQQQQQPLPLPSHMPTQDTAASPAASVLPVMDVTTGPSYGTMIY